MEMLVAFNVGSIRQRRPFSGHWCSELHYVA